MLTRWPLAMLIGVLGAALWTTPAEAQHYTWNRYPPQLEYQTSKFWHYPYYYFPANYWPSMGPKWPEPPGAPCLPPPAYMAFPPFKEPNWRYEYWEPQKYHRGSHFLLDIF